MNLLVPVVSQRHFVISSITERNVHLLPARHSHAQTQSSSRFPSSVSCIQASGVGTRQSGYSGRTIVGLRFPDPKSAAIGVDGREVDWRGGVGG